MRAVRVHEFGPPNVLKIEDNVPIPTVGLKDVLIRIMSAGVNPVDTYIRSGTYASTPVLPYIPGKDGAGIVERVGENVTNFLPNDRVFVTHPYDLSGTYAEFCCSHEQHVYQLPNSLSFGQGAAIGIPYFTAYRALFLKANAKSGEVVLIHGASGAVGLAACQMARANGLTVFGTAGSSDGLRLALENGCHKVFSHREPGYTNKILEASGNNAGVDVVIEMLSNVNLAKDLSLLKKFGRIAIVGARGTVEINPRLLMQKESIVIGVGVALSSKQESKQTGAAIQAGLTHGWLKPIVDKEYPLEKAAQAHHDIIDSPSGARGKLVLSIASQC